MFCSGGNLQRLEEMENELYESVKEQIKYADSLKDFNSMEANLLDTNTELQEAASVYRRMAEMKTMLASSQSNLEIAMMEIESLREELAEVKAYNALLLQKKLGSND